MNVQSDWIINDSSSDAFIHNKPTIPSGNEIIDWTISNVETIHNSNIPILNQNTSGSAASLSETLSIATGGTGQTTYTDGQLLIGNSTGNTLEKATLNGGDNVTITNGSGTITISSTDTTYTNATTESDGLMSSSDKIKLDDISTNSTNVQGDWNINDSSSDAFIHNKPTIPSGNEIIDWTVSGEETIHASNIPILNQNTGGSAASLSETLSVATGGTGQTTYNDGQLLIGNSTGNTLQKATLTGGSNITVTNGPGTITIGIEEDVSFKDINASGNVVVTGNLTINGTTTTVNSNTVNIGDNILVLNSDETGAASQNAGIEIERGTNSNVSFLWDETDDHWTVGETPLKASQFLGSVSVPWDKRIEWGEPYSNYSGERYIKGSSQGLHLLAGRKLELRTIHMSDSSGNDMIHLNTRRIYSSGDLDFSSNKGIVFGRTTSSNESWKIDNESGSNTLRFGRFNHDGWTAGGNFTSTVLEMTTNSVSINKDTTFSNDVTIEGNLSFTPPIWNQDTTGSAATCLLYTSDAADE